LKEAEKNNAYFNLWREFDESLVHIEHRSRLCNTLDAAHFFNTHTIARRLTENRLLAAVPGFLTAIGVIGTFAGLQMGLAGLDIGSSDVETLKSGIAGLIGGASIAFMTSVWGVFTSVLFNFYEKFLERWIRADISDFQNQVDYLYPRVTAEQSLSNIEDFSKQSMEKLAELDEKIGHKMQEAMQQASDSIRSGMEQSLNTILGPAIEKLVENAHNGSEKALESLLDKFLDGIGDVGKSQQDMMNNASQGINSAASDMAENMSEFSSKLDSQINSMMDKNAKLMVGLDKVMEKQAASQQQFEEVRQKKLDEQLGSFQSTQSKITAELDNMIQNHETQFDEVIENVSKLVKDFQTLASTNTEAAQAMQRSAADMKGSSNQLGLLSTNLNEVTKALSSQLAEMNAKVIETVEENKNNIRLVESLAMQFENLQARLEHTTSTLTQAADKAESGLSAVDKHFNQLTSSLESHVDKLNQQVANLLDDYASRVKDQTIDRLNTWNKHTESYIGAMTEAVESINTVVDEIDGKLRP
jgi:DNA anti-recombination protein RmuC